jgi:segregation and condensation protein B
LTPLAETSNISSIATNIEPLEKTIYADKPPKAKKPVPARQEIIKTVFLRRPPPKLPRVLDTTVHWQVYQRPQQIEIPINEQANGGGVNIKNIVEAILFAAGKPMTIKEIQQVFPELEQPDTLEIQEAVDAIAADYQHRPVSLQLLASGYRFQVKAGMAYWVSRLLAEKPAKYTRALLETLAIIAYRQPVTRGEIEDIRGVSVSSGTIQTLLEREWIRVIAHKEAPGRPALFGTTKQFLDYFNLTSLQDLPPLLEIESPHPELLEPQTETTPP